MTERSYIVQGYIKGILVSSVVIFVNEQQTNIVQTPLGLSYTECVTVNANVIQHK